MNTLDNIHKAAKKEFLDKGFQMASLRNIVKNAGVTTGAFYGYYKSKEAVLNKMVIRQLMDTLDETEQQIIRLRYFENKTQCEVAGILAVTQVQISRNERKILAKLRAKLEL